jgi:hypothetical protein
MMRMSATLTKAILGLALASFSITSCRKQTDYRGQSNNSNFVKPEDRPLRLAQFEQIHGTRYLMAEITEAQSRDSISSSSYSGNGNTRNLVFLDGESLASHRLFDTSAYVILATTQYPTHDKEGDSTPRSDAVVTQWLVYQVLKADTNGDGRLDVSDQQTIGVTDASGSGYAEILSGIEANFGMTMLSADQVVVVYSQGGAKSATVIDLRNRKVVSTKALADLGPDVK